MTFATVSGTLLASCYGLQTSMALYGLTHVMASIPDKNFLDSRRCPAIISSVEMEGICSLTSLAAITVDYLVARRRTRPRPLSNSAIIVTPITTTRRTLVAASLVFRHAASASIFISISYAKAVGSGRV